MIGPLEYLRVAVDPLRLAILGHASTGPVDVPWLANLLGIPERKVLQAAGRLREAGLLTEDLTLDREALRELAEAIAITEAPAPEIAGKGEWTPDEAQVLGRFFRGRRLTRIPAQRTKRIVILERLAQEFEPGIRYEEWQVDLVLKEFHPDYASLRRYMVDEGLISREAGVYWRSGGRVD